MADSFSKKESAKKKAKKKQDKSLRREDRKTNNDKGKSLEEMIMYVDINGNLTSTPPHLQDRSEENVKKRNTDNQEEVNLDAICTGVVTYFNDEKGYGFITEDKSNDNIFFHQAQLSQIVKKYFKVSYKKELSDKGYKAIEIKVLK